MSMQLVCTSKNIWAELSYEFRPSCLINLGRVGMGRVLYGPSWHGPSWFWSELSVILLILVIIKDRFYGFMTRSDSEVFYYKNCSCEINVTKPNKMVMRHRTLPFKLPVLTCGVSSGSLLNRIRLVS